jgi:hypothetical protein
MEKKYKCRRTDFCFERTRERNPVFYTKTKNANKERRTYECSLQPTTVRFKPSASRLISHTLSFPTCSCTCTPISLPMLCMRRVPLIMMRMMRPRCRDIPMWRRRWRGRGRRGVPRVAIIWTWTCLIRGARGVCVLRLWMWRWWIRRGRVHMRMWRRGCRIRRHGVESSTTLWWGREMSRWRSRRGILIGKPTCTRGRI